ncbi:hypothetical protein [Desulfurobacterium sp.]
MDCSTASGWERISVQEDISSDDDVKMGQIDDEHYKYALIAFPELLLMY